MPFFLHQVSYTPEALARLIANPQDRFDAVRGPVDKLGGRVLNSYFAFGQYDAVLITEMPDNVSAAAIALAFAAGGSLRDCQTTALLSNAEGIEAMRKAATCGYRPVQAAASAAAATPSCRNRRSLQTGLRFRAATRRIKIQSRWECGSTVSKRRALRRTEHASRPGHRGGLARRRSLRPDDSLLAREQHRPARPPPQSAGAERLNREEQVSCILARFTALGRQCCASTGSRL